jgi:hypothetical protein
MGDFEMSLRGKVSFSFISKPEYERVKDKALV